MKQDLLPELREHAVFGPLMPHATQVLATITNKTAVPVHATWSLVPVRDGQLPLVRLTLKDDAVEYVAALDTKHLSHDDLLRDELNWIWGGFLEQRSRRQLDRLKQLVMAED